MLAWIMMGRLKPPPFEYDAPETIEEALDLLAELPAVALLADATMVARRRGSERAIPASEFFQGFFETALEPDELLVEISLPRWPARTGSSFQEIARRHGDFALVGAGAVVGLD